MPIASRTEPGFEAFRGLLERWLHRSTLFANDWTSEDWHINDPGDPRRERLRSRTREWATIALHNRTPSRCPPQSRAGAEPRGAVRTGSAPPRSPIEQRSADAIELERSALNALIKVEGRRIEAAPPECGEKLKRFLVHPSGTMLAAGGGGTLLRRDSPKAN